MKDKNLTQEDRKDLAVGDKAVQTPGLNTDKKFVASDSNASLLPHGAPKPFKFPKAASKSQPVYGNPAPALPSTGATGPVVNKPVAKKAKKVKEAKPKAGAKPKCKDCKGLGLVKSGWNVDELCPVCLGKGK